MTDIGTMLEGDGWVRDPREGQAVLALWDFVYDFDDDWGGFVTGQFLLRADGVLWLRTGSGRSSGGITFHEYRPWSRWTFQRGPLDVAGAFASTAGHHYTVYPPGPVPIDAYEAGLFAESDGRRAPLTADDAHRWTAPAARPPAPPAGP